jgi:hypothetical protein
MSKWGENVKKFLTSLLDRSVDGILEKKWCTEDPNGSQNAKCVVCPVSVKLRLVDCLILVKGLLLLISISILKPNKRQWIEAIDEPRPINIQKV